MRTIKILLLVLTLLFTACSQQQSIISGELYRQKDDGQSHKFAGTKVCLFKKEHADEYQSKNISLFDPGANCDYETVTDSNGQFSIKAPQGLYVITAEGKLPLSPDEEEGYDRHGWSKFTRWNKTIPVREPEVKVFF